jgi:hypothetical protein
MKRVYCALAVLIFAGPLLAGPPDASVGAAAPPPAPESSLPTISLNVKDAPLEDVAKALGDATGTTIVVGRRKTHEPTDEPVDRYTLHVTGQPFWEVFRQLHEQHTIYIIMPRRSPNERKKLPNMVLMPGSKNQSPAALWEQHKIVIGGDYWLQVTGIVRIDNVPPYVGLNWHVVADPRLDMHIHHAIFPPLTDIIDDRGDEMKYVNTPRVGSTDIPPPGGVWPQHANLEVPTNGAKKIASLKGSFTIYELIENGDGATRQITVPFEIKDIALP